MSYVYPALVVILISTMYTTFLAFNLIPQIKAVNDPDNSGQYFYTPSEEELYGVLISFHIVFGMLITCFILASSSSPGYIPRETSDDRKRWVDGDFEISDSDDNRVKEIIQDVKADLKESRVIAWLKSIVILERKKQYGYYRHCSACNLYKPDRTHHCRICDKCVLRMDHHCPWISNCVGYRNYKTFLLLLFYAIACLCFILGGMARRLVYAFRPIMNTTTFLLEDLLVLVVYLLCMFLFIALCMFFTFHMNLTLNNMTTIELREKKNNSDPFIVHRFNVAHAKFDNGYWNNFMEVFGSPWIWLLPIFPGGTGTYLGTSAVKEDMKTQG
eukprot:CAMPEP_0197524790 /NCGR_PEP_ID=MMETSP1318-20131121/9888_1 /TAXON_ID=552666 /ORGANISM="Partenskyella glossopodia, Strain RCC365" /LENGTH=328 /DNA_ID=CAMNT_0043077829 /DNA_START=138 /DNA_END=1124 /DNA_ORIENTATION=-